jgi:Ankyrin repeats (3 copies)/Ankyrin repeat
MKCEPDTLGSGLPSGLYSACCPSTHLLLNHNHPLRCRAPQSLCACALRRSVSCARKALTTASRIRKLHATCIAFASLLSALNRTATLACSCASQSAHGPCWQRCCVQVALQDALQRGASPDVRDARGRPVLYLAALRGHAHVCRALLAAGADANAAYGAGNTPVSIAAGDDARSEALAALLSHDPSLANRPCGKDAVAPIIQAAASAPACAATLLQSGADARARDAAGQTALHVACRRGNEACVRDLLAHNQHLVTERVRCHCNLSDRNDAPAQLSPTNHVMLGPVTHTLLTTPPAGVHRDAAACGVQHGTAPSKRILRAAKFLLVFQLQFWD